MAGAGLSETLKDKPFLITIGLLGLLLMMVGAISLGALRDGREEYGNKVEVMELKGEEDSGKHIFVDVSGGVMKPGMYQLMTGDRINEALVAAEGLAEKADRQWVSKNLNLAQKLTDGQKIYIPLEGEMVNNGSGDTEGVSLGGKINVNTAGIAELDRLWGVGEATAKKIVENRPYGSVEELLTKKVLKANVYEEIKDEVSVY